MYVFDATPLIYLGSVDQLALAEKLPEECCMPRRVYHEVVTAGIEGGNADARRVERRVERGTFEVHTTESGAFDRLRQNENLSDADAAVLALADAYEATAIVDEAYGRRVADAEAIPTRGTAFIVLKCLQRREIDADEALATIDAMLDAGWYCAPDVYAKIRDRIDELS